MHRHRHHADARDPDDAIATSGAGEATVARALAVVTFVGFALHYRYGSIVLDLGAFAPSDPLRHFGFPIFASALLSVEPAALLVALLGLVLGAAPLERRLGAGWTWALFFWGHLAGIGAQLTFGANHLAAYRTWGPNAGILAVLVASAALSRQLRREYDRDFEVQIDSAPAPRFAALWLAVYVLGTLAVFAIDRAGSLGVSGEGALAGMAVGALGAWTYRSGSSLGRLFGLAGALARLGLAAVLLVAGFANREALLQRFAAKSKKHVTVAAAGFEPVAPADVAADAAAFAPSREPTAAERKLDSFLDKELGERELVFAAIDPTDRTVAFAGGALWISGRWVPAAMLWDQDGFAAAGGGMTVRVQRPDARGDVSVLVNGSPIDQWPGRRFSALRLRQIATKTTKEER